MKNFIYMVLAFSSALVIVGCSNHSNDAQENFLLESNNAIDWQYQMSYQRGIEVVNWAIPAVSIMNMRKANFGLGGDFNTIYYMSKPPTALAEALTANNITPYSSIFLTTKNGPVVLEIPPATAKIIIFGSAINVWQAPVADIGAAGSDQGKGGKYLFLPPNYHGEIPDGYLVVPSNSNGIYVGLRLIPLAGTSFFEASQYAKNIRTYPLSQAGNPPKGHYVDMADKHLPTLPNFDLRFFEDVAQLLDEEPLLERDKVMGGMLASIGIKKGTSFAPKGKIKKALEKAVIDGYKYLEYKFENPGFSSEIYWHNRQWLSIKHPSEQGFVFDEGEYLLLDERGSLYHWATFIPRYLGKASAYLLGLHDADGKLLSGKHSYKLKLPAKIPARNFWSVIAYNKNTKAFIYNDDNVVGLSSFDSLQVNDDGTIDIYFGEMAPTGVESNWIPTADKDFFLLFRLYGPEQAFFDKSFTLNDLEQIN